LTGALLSFALAVPFGLIVRRRLSTGSPAYQRHRAAHPLAFWLYTGVWASVAFAFIVNGITALITI
jgi:hypothetical protein